MVRLCTHHQKQFIRVLNDIYTEVQPGAEDQPLLDSENMDASVCRSGCSQPSTENWHKAAPCSEAKPQTDSDRDPRGLPSSLCAAAHALRQHADVKSLDRVEHFSPAFRRDSSELAAARASAVSPKESTAHGYLTASNSSSLNFQPGSRGPEPQGLGQEQEAGARKPEEDRDLVQGVNGSDGGFDGCLPAPRSSFRAFPEEAWDSGFAGLPARRADKENALQCSSKAPSLPDAEPNDQDARPKQENHLHALARAKAVHPSDRSPCERSRDGWLASATLPDRPKASGGRARAKTGPSATKAARRNKRASGLRINDYDNQCDVVYISQPITECHVDSQQPAASRRTARKSTRGYYFNGECCELPTVRTLAKGRHGEEGGKGPTPRTQAALSARQSPAPAEEAQAAGKEAERRASLRLLSKGAAPGRDAAEKAPSPGGSLTAGEAACTRLLLAQPAPPCPGDPPGAVPAPTQALANGPCAAQGSLEATCQLLERPQADGPQQATSGADPCAEHGPSERSSGEAVPTTPPPAPGAAGVEGGALCSEIPAGLAPPPAGLNPASPAGLGPMPPTAGLGPAPPPAGLGPAPPPAGLGPAPPPAGLGPASPAGRGPTPPPASLGPTPPPAGLGPAPSPTGLGPAPPPAGLSPASPAGRGPTPPPAGLGPASPAGLGPTPPPAGLGAASPPAGLGAASPPAGLGAASPPAGLGAASPPAGLGAASPPAGLGPTPPPAGLGAASPPAGLGAASPPAGLGAASPASLGPTPPPAGLDPASPASLSPASPPAGLGPTGLDPASALQLPTTVVLAPPAGLDPAPPLQLSSTVALAPPTGAGPALHAELPSNTDSERPAGADLELVEALPTQPPASGDAEPPTPLAAGLQPEPPASLQSVDVTEAVPADPEAEVGGVQDGPLEPSEAVLASAQLQESLARETAAASSQPCEHGIGAGETPLAPDSLGAGEEGTVPARETLDKKQKKSRRVLIASDRCLRSQQGRPPPDSSAETSAAPASLQLPCLQIKLSKRPGAKRFRREVHLGGAVAVCFPEGCFHKTLLQSIVAPDPSSALAKEPEQLAADEDGVTTRQTYKSMLGKAGSAERDGLSKAELPAKVSHSKSGEMLEICVEANSDRRSVLLPREGGTGVQGAEQSDGKPEAGENPESARDTGKGLDKGLSDSPPGPGSKSGSKHLPSKTWKQKNLAIPAYNLRHAPTPLDTARRSVSGKEALQANSNQKEELSSGNKDPLGLKEVAILAEDKPKFVEWCAEEENQELIADFNAQYMKVQKGWIQLEKDAQPAPKVKNRADKLKEIWKSKKRTRKCRAALEVQRLSPVQMLFMKAFRLSNICRWFLETTETRSLIIVKKLNTRLPGDVPPIKLPLQKYCSAGLYPSSLQAERLKKHLKKFAATTPAKNNLKNQKLWARLQESADQAEPEGAASPNPTSPCDASPDTDCEERNMQLPVSLPAQASSRILRKYSNLRGRLRAQPSLAKSERKGDGGTDPATVEGKQSRKSVCINPLMSPRLALQVKADVFPAKLVPTEAAVAKGRKGKGRSQEASVPRAEPLPSRKRPPRESSPAPSSSRDRLPAKKGGKGPRPEGPPKAPATRKQAAAEGRSAPDEREASKEKGVPKRQQQGKSPVQKGKVTPAQRAALLSSHRGLPKSTPKPKARAEPSARVQKAAERKPSSGKTLTRAMKRVQESGSSAQGKRKLRAKGDSSHSKRTRLDAK
ncbi:uncharacterized protein LOC142016154 [Carettochelys insculpta]|uniref:uncharacterized protein LOC142016154 n=1 Tax=Carettochelys insculpta TaxID=44489 RepID=UPI003EB71A3C